ncbi:MAG: UDP-N-acetylenolpyruvoylglucosamine reductase [Candidatus Puniceispirillum sp.]|nr:UDP-N-acetylenolpyruvoylglucosamine reductase [Candidatus Puniceispirillum sp.]
MDYSRGQALLSRLPKVRGRYSADAPLSKITWFQVGGPADVLFKPADPQDLAFFLQERPKDIPLHILGVGSNLLVRDGGVPGVVIRLGRGFTNLAIAADGVTLDVGAGVLDRTVALIAQEEGIGGLEFLVGIPGTMGGALKMNAGCYGTEMKDVLDSALVITDKGQLMRLTPQELGMSYRHTTLPDSWVVVSVRLKGHAEESSLLKERLDTLLAQREASQPVRTRTGGSTFANPDGCRAWELIDQAGCRGLRIGGAQVSPMHCNFLINTGDATAQDLETLGEHVRARVLETSGVDLRWEIQRWGDMVTSTQVYGAEAA